MYAYIKGTFVQRRDDSIIVENGGVGYRIYTLSPMSERFGKTGDLITVHTYLYVREDTFALYGFPSAEEHDLFIMLLQVSGIGPKVALAIVAQVSPSQFALAVITGDIKKLTQVKGVGKKGAERLVLELKDKLKGFSAEDGKDFLSNDVSTDSVSGEESVIFEATGALIVLGYSSADARKAVRAVYKEGIPVEDLIRQALRAFL